MSEYIMGLGIAVKICKIYEELIYLSFSNNEMTSEYNDNILKLKELIEEETTIYDKLEYEDICEYFDKFSVNDVRNFDAVKSRYYYKLKERKNLYEDNVVSLYPFSLNSAIVGKILLETLVSIEKLLISLDTVDENNVMDNNSIYNLYSFHKTHKYTLIASNDFLERLIIDFNFNLLSIPNISFDKIKDNFECSDTFYKYLNEVLLIMGKEIIDNLISNNSNNTRINDIYANLFNISQLKVIISYLNKQSLYELINYCNNLKINKYPNGRYIYTLLRGNGKE